MSGVIGIGSLKCVTRYLGYNSRDLSKCEAIKIGTITPTKQWLSKLRKRCTFAVFFQKNRARFFNHTLPNIFSCQIFNIQRSRFLFTHRYFEADFFRKLNRTFPRNFYIYISNFESLCALSTQISDNMAKSIRHRLFFN